MLPTDDSASQQEMRGISEVMQFSFEEKYLGLPAPEGRAKDSKADFNRSKSVLPKDLQTGRERSGCRQKSRAAIFWFLKRIHSVKEVTWPVQNSEAHTEWLSLKQWETASEAAAIMEQSDGGRKICHLIWSGNAKVPRVFACSAEDRWPIWGRNSWLDPEPTYSKMPYLGSTLLCKNVAGSKGGKL